MKKSLLFSFGFIGEVGFATAIPLVIFGLFGRYLDNKYGTSPYFLLGGITVATIQIYFYIKALIKKAIEAFNKLNQNP
ncbi:MAG: putative F0F1-ATPase [bacterium ADurb.Bin400]|nr:MAG: putative F0F1-ATPase [bacterium ADurb.Bin400]